MNMQRFITPGFIAGGLINIAGMLLFSKGFTNDDLGRIYPEVFSRFSMFTIVLWGLAYITVSSSYAQVRWLVLVFAVEKVAYGVTWICWMSQYHGELPRLLGDAPLAGFFMAIYGPNDWAFALFFAWVFFVSRPKAV